jgi:centromere protein C
LRPLDIFPDNNDEDTDGLRRSKRVRYEPLEWWRCEKVVYGRRKSGGRQVVPVIKEIIRIPKEEHLPLSKKRSSRKPRSRKQERRLEDDDEDDEDREHETDWDVDTSSRGVVLDFPTNDEVERSEFSSQYKILYS